MRIRNDGYLHSQACCHWPASSFASVAFWADSSSAIVIGGKPRPAGYPACARSWRARDGIVARRPTCAVMADPRRHHAVRGGGKIVEDVVCNARLVEGKGKRLPHPKVIERRPQISLSVRKRVSKRGMA